MVYATGSFGDRIGERATTAERSGMRTSKEDAMLDRIRQLSNTKHGLVVAGPLGLIVFGVILFIQLIA